jgi:Subtilase family
MSSYLELFQSQKEFPMTTQRELIVITNPNAGLRASRTAVASLANSNVDPLNALLTSRGATILPIFGNENRVSQVMSIPTVATALNAAGVPDLTTFYRLVANDNQLDDLAENLRNLELVDGAYIKPAPQSPVFIEEGIAPPNQQEAPPITPDYISSQLYLEAAPGGIDARFAWTRPGGKGQGVQIIDIEGAWRFSHEDLIQNQGGVIGGTQSADIGWRNHGTAVVGEFGGDENSFGVTGISPQANVRAISIFGAGQGSAKAITDAANALNPGDIILIELHAPGPRHNFTDVGGQLGFIAMEFWPDNFAAIVYATAVRGVIVVEAGGNGAENYDDPLYNSRPTGFPVTWTNPFNLANPQSGAIIVGAGAPPPGTHGRNHGADRSRLDFSNYGVRVDVQGWGREVTTAGYGNLQGGSNEDLWYTDTFSGTSSASPIIVGAIANLQGALRAANKTLLTPATARDILRNTGSSQQNEPGRPATQRIGNRPDLKQALTSLGLGGVLMSDHSQNNDPLAKVSYQDDAALPADVPAGGARNLWSLAQTVDLVADVTLIKSISHVPAPLRIVVTDYEFQVHEVIKGDAGYNNIVVRNDGGELSDGTGMESLNSYKLTVGGRYLIFGRKIENGYWLTNVLRIEDNGMAVAIANGRVVVGLRQGNLLTRPEVSFSPLRYLPSLGATSLEQQGPPDQGSFPVSGVEEGLSALDSSEPLTAEQIKQTLRNSLMMKGMDDLPPKSSKKDFNLTDLQPTSVTLGGYVSESTNFYCQLSDNNNWNWFQQCEVNWNQLVGNSSSGRNWLFGYYNDASGNPIRNEAPVANNGRNNLGVMTSAQMTAGGYPTWETLSANGVCYNWYTTTNGRVKETDVLINAAIATNEAQYRKSLTHELGHALTLDHEDRYFALLYPGTWQQPPNYASYWYSRTDDHVGARNILEWVNTNIEANRWNLLSFADMATYSQSHSNPGTSGNLVMTSLSTTTVTRGSRVTFRNVHVENRGNIAATNVTLKFYLSWNPIISNIDTEIASYTWNSFGGLLYWSGSLDALIPAFLSPGTYYAGWVLTSNTSELTTSNNTAILLKDSTSNFAEQTIVVQ